MSQKELDTSNKPEEDIKELIFKKFQEQEYDAVYRLIKHGKFTNTEDLLKLWDEAHYKQKEELLKKPLTTLMRFRVRKRNPPPESICPGGIRPKRHLPKHATERLKFWLHQHRSNPYPNKLEKQMLAEETGVTYNQVKTWFSNSRRLLQQRNTRSEQGEGQRHWYAGNCLDDKDNQCPCEDSHGCRAFESCLTAERDVTNKMESDSYADSDGSVQRENTSKDTEIKMPSKDSLFSRTPKDQDASAICSWTGECISEPSNFVHEENISLKDQTNDATVDCHNVPNDTNLNPANNIKEYDSWDNKPLTKTPQINAEHMNNRYQSSSELGTCPKLEPPPCFSPKVKKECVSYQRISHSPLHTDGEICTSSRDSHFSAKDNRHKRMSSPANCLSIGLPLISIAKNNMADLVPDSNCLQARVSRDQAPVALQNTTSLKQNHSRFGTEYGAYLKSHHGTSKPDILCKDRKLHVSGDSGYQTDGNGGHGHRMDSITGEIGTRVSLSSEKETWDSLSSTGDEFSEFDDDDDDDDDDVCYTMEPSCRPDYLKTESESISECSQGNNADYSPYQNGSSYSPSFFSSAANHSTASYRNESRYDDHWQRWANRLQPLNSDLNGIANSSKDCNSGFKDDNSGSRFNLVGRSEMMYRYYGMVTQNLAFLPGSLKSEQIDVRHGEDYKMEYGHYIRNPSQNCNKFISGTYTQSQLPFSQEGLPISANSSVTYRGSAQYATRNYCMLCGTVTSQIPCWCVLWYQRQQYFDATANILHARKSDTSFVKQECLNQDESSNQVHLSGTENGSNQVHLSITENGSNQVHLSGTENGSNQINLSGTENGSNQVHLSGAENRNNHVPVHLSEGENFSFQIHPIRTENDSKPAQLGFYSESSLDRNSVSHIMGHLSAPYLQMTPHPIANLSGNYASASSTSRNEDTIQPVFLGNSYNQPAPHQVWWPFLPNVYNPMLTETHRSNYCFPVFTNTANFTSRLVQPSSRPTLGPIASGYRPQDSAYGATVPMILPSAGQHTGTSIT